MAGLAALEIMQTVSAWWQALAKEGTPPNSAGRKNSKKKGVASAVGAPDGLPPESIINGSGNGESDGTPNGLNGTCGTGSGSDIMGVALSEDSSPSAPLAMLSSAGALKWRDVFSISVRWRQVSEPCDPVAWVDLLT